MNTNTTIQDKIQAIINTIQSLEIKADYDTMNKLLGCLQLLGAMKADAKDWIILKPDQDAKADKKSEETEEVQYEEIPADE